MIDNSATGRCSTGDGAAHRWAAILLDVLREDDPERNMICEEAPNGNVTIDGRFNLVGLAARLIARACDENLLSPPRQGQTPD